MAELSDGTIVSPKKGRKEAVEKIAQNPVETHKYAGKRYLTLDSIDRILKLLKQPSSPPPVLTRKRAESAVPLTDCSGRKYTPDEWEDNVRYVILGAEIQRDADVEYYKGYLR